MAQHMIADNEIDLAAARALLWQAVLGSSTQGGGHRGVVAGQDLRREAVGRIVDRSVQIAARLGISDDLVLGRIYAEIRPFRIYDGAVRSAPDVDRAPRGPTSNP